MIGGLKALVNYSMSTEGDPSSETETFPPYVITQNVFSVFLLISKHCMHGNLSFHDPNNASG